MTDRVINREALAWYHSHVASQLQFARSPRSRGALHVRAPEKHRAVHVPSWGVGTGAGSLRGSCLACSGITIGHQVASFFTLSLTFTLDNRLNHPLASQMMV